MTIDWYALQATQDTVDVMVEDMNNIAILVSHPLAIMALGSNMVGLLVWGWDNFNQLRQSLIVQRPDLCHLSPQPIANRTLLPQVPDIHPTALNDNMVRFELQMQFMKMIIHVREYLEVGLSPLFSTMIMENTGC